MDRVYWEIPGYAMSTACSEIAMSERGAPTSEMLMVLIIVSDPDAKRLCRAIARFIGAFHQNRIDARVAPRIALGPDRGSQWARDRPVDRRFVFGTHWHVARDADNLASGRGIAIVTGGYGNSHWNHLPIHPCDKLRRDGG